MNEPKEATVHDLGAYRNKRVAQKKVMDSIMFGIRYGNPNGLVPSVLKTNNTYFQKMISIEFKKELPDFKLPTEDDPK